MQALCPQCSQKIAIDDAKVPDRPFSVRCPRCQNVVRLPGKGGTAEAAPITTSMPSVSSLMSAPPPPPIPPSAPPPTPVFPSPTSAESPGASHAQDEMRAQVLAQLRRELSGGEPVGHALVAFPDAAHSAVITLALTRLGYHVNTVDDFDEGARLLEQGNYPLVATARVGAGPGRESLYQRIARLSPDSRRRLFVILVGDELKTGDGTQAFLVLADLVLNTRDAGTADQLILSTVLERKRLYQAYEEARKRFAESGSA